MAKKLIQDLDNPTVASVIEAYQAASGAATEKALAKGDAVRPIFALDERTRRVRHVGSCVLIIFEQELFAFSASHVFDSVGKYRLLIGCGDRLHPVGGDRFSSKRGPSGSHRDDFVDASVYHMLEDVPEIARDGALRLSDLDLLPAPRSHDLFVICGYREAMSRSTSTGHQAHLDVFSTIESSETHYEHFGRTREHHLLVDYSDQVLIGGNWRKTPSLRGVSGGGIFRASGTIAPGQVSIGYVKLSAILIEHRKPKARGLEPVAVGTRLNYHFGLIDKYLPHLQFAQRLAEEHERQSAATRLR